MTTGAGLDDGRVFSTGQAALLNVRLIRAQDGGASFRIDLPFGDGRDGDPHFRETALRFAADVAALMSVRSRLDEERERINGTASLHLNLLAEPMGCVTVQSTIVYWSSYEGLTEIVGRDEAGRPVMHGLSAYSLRPVEGVN